MDIEKFKKFLKDRGITDQKIEENLKNSQLFLKISANGPVTVAHIDQIVLLVEGKKVEPRIIESLKRTGALLLDFQRSLATQNKPMIPIHTPPDTEKEKYPYGFASRLYVKIPFSIFILIILFLLASKYIEFKPSSFFGRTKVKLDDIVYPLPFVGGLPKVVKDNYQAAIHDVTINDLEMAEIHLKKAVLFKPDFTEAWYNLGATQTRIAMSLAKENKNKEAIDKFKEAVASKKKSKELMDKNIWYKYKDYEQAEVRHDVVEALEYADETASNESILLFLLRVWK